MSYSSGKLNSNVLFDLVFECKVCSPVEGMLIDYCCKNITKAGIGKVDDSPSPLIIFLARDHHQTSSNFNSMEVDRKIKIRVLVKDRIKWWICIGDRRVNWKLWTKN